MNISETSGSEALRAKLKRARESRGLSTRAVAMALAPEVSITHATIANYEAGRTVPSVEIVAALARIYGQPASEFLRAEGHLQGVRWRNRKSKLKTADIAAFEESSVRWLLAYRRVENLLGQSHARPLQGPLKVGPGDRPEKIAREVRELLKLTDTAPVPSVVQAAAVLGVRLLELEGNDAIDGLAGELDGEAVVVLNARASHDRARLNAAHELFHHLLEHCATTSKLNHKEMEDAAFACARNFLMPQRVLREAFDGKSFVKLLRYKETYGISLSAMIYAAQQEGILSERESRWIWIEFSRRGWRAKEPGIVRPDRATRFEELLEQLLRTNYRGRRSELAAELNVPAHELDARLKNAVLSASAMPLEESKGGRHPNNYEMKIAE